MIGGDSVDPTLRKNMEKLVADLDLLLTGGKEFTIVLDDPAGNVYVQVGIQCYLHIYSIK